MEEKEKEQLIQIGREFLDENLLRIVISNPSDKQGVSKVKVRPLLLKGSLIFQAEELVGNQAFHKNFSVGECISYIVDLLDGMLRQMELESRKGQVRVLMSKKGSPSIKIKRQQKIAATSTVPQHNRQKSYILKEGTPVPFLVDLGVMTAEGKVIASRYDKFRQINRFLEFIEDILPRLDKSRENVIIDFGCGKSYLTFAMYYYLHELKGYLIRVIGLDLKQTVIDDCNRLGERYGYDKLKFYHGDIASYEGVDHVDMVVTLHACDTATDYALAKAVRWGASVILSVPCCQHELNKTIHQELMAPVFQYGLIRERMAALYTDALRAEILESQGYRTQILEFIDMEHTPKNILIRGVKQGGKKDNRREIQEIMEFLHGKLTLADLLIEEDKNQKVDGNF
ncbi:class I SAM-dependent methyltransferase [Lacrimispora celerecrescens]|uniref:Methyltransferase family protein n=1 Tax=[Clostridium] celerecrescens 18A TaxID=1286362 RepID=A0A2M8Z4B4_9FIRM|nr:SAM-dependent methyltransferase [Lacrimispora celerecrescens]PJJ28292.1 methyltransferase family protein [[Clostridium] celerecrescens 18A]